MLNKIKNKIKYSDVYLLAQRAKWSVEDFVKHPKEHMTPITNEVQFIDDDDEHKRNIKFLIKAVAVLAVAYNIKATVLRAIDMESVIKDIYDSFVCGAHEDFIHQQYNDETAKMWARLAFEDKTNQETMKKFIKAVIQLIASVVVATKR